MLSGANKGWIFLDKKQIPLVDRAFKTNWNLSRVNILNTRGVLLVRRVHEIQLHVEKRTRQGFILIHFPKKLWQVESEQKIRSYCIIYDYDYTEVTCERFWAR